MGQKQPPTETEQEKKIKQAISKVLHFLSQKTFFARLVNKTLAASTLHGPVWVLMNLAALVSLVMSAIQLSPSFFFILAVTYAMNLFFYCRTALKHHWFSGGKYISKIDIDTISETELFKRCAIFTLLLVLVDVFMFRQAFFTPTFMIALIAGQVFAHYSNMVEQFLKKTVRYPLVFIAIIAMTVILCRWCIPLSIPKVSWDHTVVYPMFATAAVIIVFYYPVKLMHKKQMKEFKALVRNITTRRFRKKPPE